MMRDRNGNYNRGREKITPCVGLSLRRSTVVYLLESLMPQAICPTRKTQGPPLSLLVPAAQGHVWSYRHGFNQFR